ncbi:hypothetical protein KHQ81_07110 [Mycoplasmatota bacterium]|nr:hypothetical protein KHQ81_07110 [Mycoplasmatota bacterium]
MDNTLYSDFENYVNENGQLISHLENEQSLLNEFITPIIKSLSYLMLIMKAEEEEPSKDVQELFEYGLNYMFENLEEIKLYLRQLNNDYTLLDKMSLYIKIVFDLEELKLEIEKNQEIDEEEKSYDLKRIDQSLEFFEENIVPNVVINEFELDKYLNLYYELLDKYTELTLMSEAFIEYCAAYGI